MKLTAVYIKSFWITSELVHHTNWRWRTFGQKIKFAARLFEATNYSACDQTRRYDMDVGCSLQGFGASTMTLQHHLDFAMPPISKNPPSLAQVEQCCSNKMILIEHFIKFQKQDS